jgi:GT2 family glycosyltransferase
MLKNASIIVNWNDASSTIRCLQSLLSIQNIQNFLIIVVDNQSSDTSLAQVITWLNTHTTTDHRAIEYLLLQNTHNLGYAGGNNAGIRYALQARCDFIWILNNDTCVSKYSLENLLNYCLQHPKIGCCGSTIVELSHPNTVQCAAGSRYFPLFTIRRDISKQQTLQQAINQVNSPRLDYVSGASMFLRSEALRKVGLLNEQFFLYYEELDLAKRLNKAGYELGWCRNSIVQHQQGSSTRQHINHEKVAQYHENLSTLIYTRIHHPSLLLLAGTFRLCAKLLILPLRGKSGLIGSVLKAYLDFARGNYPRTSVRADTETRVITKINWRGNTSDIQE